MKHPTASEWLMGVGLVVALGAVIWNFDPFGRRKHAEQVAVDAIAQTHVAQAGTQALDHYSHDTIVIRERAQDAAAQVRQSPGADQPLDPAFRRSLCAGLERLRGDPACVD